MAKTYYRPLGLCYGPDAENLVSQRRAGVLGGSASIALNVANNAAVGSFSEALNASFGGTTGQANTNGGSFSNLAAGSSNTTAMLVSVNNTQAGNRTGSVTLAYQTDGTGSNGNASIGPVNVGGNWSGSSIAAGVTNPDVLFFGNAGDAIIAGGTPIGSRIASITIGGYIRGTAGGTDHYGFAARHIGPVTVADTLIPRSTALRPIGLTGDFAIHEVA